jgi:ribosomal protein L11 methyltransferase
MRWAAIRIRVDGVGGAEAAGELLVRSGSAGVAHDIGHFDLPVAVTGYLPEDERLAPAIRRIEAALTLLPTIGIDSVAAELVVTMIDEEDWANAWKQYFKPIRIGRSIVVSPPWESADLQPGDRLLVIDPGMAFGTGTHPTTQLCLVALEDYVPANDIVRVADIGTGSGILAIAAKKLGAPYVLATDIDPLAIRIAAENAAANSVVIDFRSQADWSRPYDLLVANILADILIDFAQQFAAAVRPGGFYVASGIIEGRETDVRNCTERMGFRHIETRRQGEWVALIFQR